MEYSFGGVPKGQKNDSTNPPAAAQNSLASWNASLQSQLDAYAGLTPSARTEYTNAARNKPLITHLPAFRRTCRSICASLLCSNFRCAADAGRKKTSQLL